MTQLLMSAAELYARLGTPGLVILDVTVDLQTPRFDGDYRVRSGYEGWHQAHLPGAVHADLLEGLTDPDAGYSFAMPAADAFAEQLQLLGIGPHSTLVLYDSGDGFWAARLWWMLRSVGIPAFILDGGLQLWRHAGLPLHSGSAVIEPTTEAPPVRPVPRAWASQEEVLAISQGHAPGQLLCALSSAVFDGSAITRYARRGHIPGSLNRPARNLYQADHRYQPAAVLRAALGEGLLADNARLVLYCGGGISAAATAVALTLLGRDNVALYDGSLQQWSANPALPMSSGAAPA
ncbi:sulfurtransferase [Pseudomonas sp. Marseille-Q5115]|uniref:sulfurtransferase n=1 Tax=Pseudomonas sp. Marseille-Q5115 TaxID=2866593 RepID=UPI001CE464EC|nr:rhodanese-like domain-containing protein [Pseudomonas sp. Marseille-Q5115]